MTAPQIPNLLSLQGESRPKISAARRRGRPTASTIDFDQRRDIDIQETDSDAAVSRMSAVTLGYLTDPYASLFVQEPIKRRLPIINRGTYSRIIALDALIKSFLSYNDFTKDSSQKKQIISLGAGTDTRYFRLRDSNKHTNVIYHEFDFPVTSAAKREKVSSHAEQFGLSESECFWSASQSKDNEGLKSQEWGFMYREGNIEEVIYCFHPIDLRKIGELKSSSAFFGLRTDVPTLILSECCLCYMNVIESKSVVEWFTKKIPSIGVILYEPIGAHDSFGQMMISNLASRNITMPSLAQFNSLSDQRMRLSQMGFNGLDPNNGCEAEDIEKIWNEWIPASEKQRIDNIECLDEVEEWQMLARHYAVVWGWRSMNSEWQNWAKH